MTSLLDREWRWGLIRCLKWNSNQWKTENTAQSLKLTIENLSERRFIVQGGLNAQTGNNNNTAILKIRKSFFCTKETQRKTTPICGFEEN